MKLKKLVLAGFKSFADRTELEFHDGISCVVGPNGCGKSNIVDAVKWVLGEQSAKSLRGSEMLDVIFNGSSARKAAGCAEVTLVFDNSAGLLQNVVNADAGEGAMVSVTRRLFRDGVSEYLINKTPARLRDIREMFMGTGVGVDAYSLIEQGRVEAFLQASQDDRRAIFDEAAGISKYKARKKEALRKLERVEQNLLRVNDVLQEVQKRLRSIKYQAGKARNYQAYSERLKELRSLHLLAQYHTLSHQRTDLQKRFDEAADAMAAVAGRIEQLESAGSAAEAELADLDRGIREVEGRLSAVGASMTAAQQRSEMLAARVKELGDQIAAAASHSEAMEAKIASFDESYTQRQAEQQALEASLAELGERYESSRQEHTVGELAINKLSATLEDEKAGTIDLFRRTAHLHNQANASRVRRDSLHGQKTRLASRAEEVAGGIQGMLTQRVQLEASLSEIQDVLGDAQSRLEQNRQASREVSDAESRLRDELSAAREERSAVTSRRDALREMQSRLEGVNAGVRSVLKAVRDGKLPDIVGMLGDFIVTDVRHAPLVEAALAGADQQLVVRNIAAAEAMAAELRSAVRDGGSVELLCLEEMGPLGIDPQATMQAQGAARVIDFVSVDAVAAPAVWRLLGRTLAVESLAAAQQLARNLDGWRFVTPGGEVVEADGRVRFGAANRGAGVIARRSELAELQRRLEATEARIGELDRQREGAKHQREHLEEVQQQLRTAIYEANTERVEAESRLRGIKDQIERLQREQPLLARDIERLAAEIEQTAAAERDAAAQAQELERIHGERQQQIEKLTAELAAARQRQGELARQMTEARVALAQAEEKMRAMTEALAALRRQREQMEQDFSATRAQMQLDRQRRADAEEAIVKAADELRRLAAQRQTLVQQSQELTESRSGLLARQEDIRSQLASQRKAHDEAATTCGNLRVELSEADVRIEGLIGRATDEGMALLEGYASYRHDEGRDWDAVAAEIQDLRDKIERLGNVNLDAISEQEELEKREKFLGEQLADIRASQEQLSELIRKINKDSRDMFVQTFEAVRANFQELFRKLFGGGKADIMLMNPDDVLESGIEIVARPPGKETRSLSLLSGGEKTMTALALLFSIFRSRPSPFCLLDEVDAALDEANNRRFNTLVQEFVSTSQFIIITHAKRTMSMADVLYGVTMQEPGVSKRISVRFEDAGRSADSALATVG
jgi:chromosome segregation protein